jgi:predicted nuclease of restriction endonuclease-like (RecB) superfamily
MSKKFADFPPDYADWLAGIKTRVQAARSRAALAANVELVSLYWQIGNEILQRQQVANWGDKVLDRLASDLRGAFPEMKGFSRANLKFMRAFAQAWPEPAIGQQAVSQLPWGHNVMLLTKLKDPVQRVHYAQHALVRHITQFLLELGSGFAFIGRQFRLEVSDEEFFVDLLFYHTRLKCYVVV